MMRGSDLPLFAIEAKALQVELTEKAAAQLVEYCVVEGIEWAALTNGRELRFFNTYLKGDLAAKLILRLDLLAFNSDAEYDALFDQLWLLSRESMTTPTGVRTWLEQRPMDQALRGALLSPASPIVKALHEHLIDRDIKASVEDIVAWFRAGLPVNITPLPVMANLEGKAPPLKPAPATTQSPKPPTLIAVTGGARHYILPASRWGEDDAVTHLHSWLDRGMWGMGESTPGRKHLQAGDYVCFYAAGLGIVATATIEDEATTLLQDDDIPGGPQDHPLYRVPLRDIAWLSPPVVIDEALRAGLDAYKGKSNKAAWGWLVQTTREVSPHDFAALTGRFAPGKAADSA